MTVNISKILLPSIVGISVYLIINKLFPEKVESLEKEPMKDLRGGNQIRLVHQITKKLLTNKALKIALISIFAKAGVQHFQSEIEALLVDDIFKKLCNKNVD
jgi:hypothetical protein